MGQWANDPTGRYRWRWCSSPGVWTDLVSDGSRTFKDPTPPPPPPDVASHPSDPSPPRERDIREDYRRSIQEDSDRATQGLSTDEPMRFGGKTSTKSGGGFGKWVAGGVVALLLVWFLWAMSGGDENPSRDENPSQSEDSSLTAREKACADNWGTVSHAEMLRMKQDSAIDGIYEWSGGYWVSYDKIMDIC